jgi:hypothetical protein
MKNSLLFILVFLPLFGFSQTELVKWEGIVNYQPSNVPTSLAAYVAAENFTASNNVNFNTTWNGWETSGWPAANAAADYTKYYQMSLRPTSGATLIISKIRFKYQGEYKKFEVRYSKTAEFTNSVSLGITNPANFYNTATQKDLSVNIPVLAGERLYIRIFVYDQSGNSTFKILPSNGGYIPPTVVGYVTPPQPLTGNYIIGQAPSNDYKTITDAVSALNNLGVQGPVTFLLNDAQYNNTLGEVFPITLNQFSGSSAINTVTIRPNTGVTTRIDAYNANGGIPLPAVFKFNGADNIIIDGSSTTNGNGRNLTIDNNEQLSYTNRSVIWLVSPSAVNAPENITIKNAYIQNSFANADYAYAMGIYAGADSAPNSGLTVGQSASKIKNLTVSNVDFLNVKEGVYVLDGSSTATALQNVIIEKNDFGGTTTAERIITAIYVSGVNGFTVNRNTMTGIYRNSNGGDLGFAGIQVAGLSTNGVISSNRISQVEKTLANGYGIAGINLSSTAVNTNITVVNNMILDVIGPGNGGENQNGFGIGIFSGSGYKLYHNTVKLSKKQFSNAGISAALFIENNVTNLDVRNNIFINRQPENSRRFAIYVAAAGQNTFAQLNNNNYNSIDAMGSIGSFYTASNIKTFAEWKTATAKDAASTQVNPVFASDEDLHLAQFSPANFSLNNSGAPVGVINDIDGDARNAATPDVGADELGSATCETSTTYTADGTWTNGLPAGDKAVIINGNYSPTTDIEACSLTVTATGYMVMPTGKNLFVVNRVTVETGGNLILESNSDLVQVNNVANSGIANVKRNSSKIKRLDYTLWSSPVTGSQSLFDFSPLTLANRFYVYNTAENAYTAIQSPSTTQFSLAKGYLIRTPNNHPDAIATVYEGVFTGTLNNGPVSYPMVYEGSANAYNAVGNPYPSPINVNDFIDANINTIEGTIWFWRKTNDPSKSSYSTLTKLAYVANAAPGGENDYAVDPHGVLNTGQGFIVKAKSASNIVFTNAMRKANSSDQFFRTSNDSSTGEDATSNAVSRIWLNVINAEDAFSQMVVGYTPMATPGLDNGIDGKSIGDGSISLYSMVGDVTLAIQGRPEFTADDVVTLGFKTSVAGSFDITIDHMDGIFLGEQAIYIKDNVTGTVHNLKDGNYTFTSEAGTFNDRFEVVYTHETLGTALPVISVKDVVVLQQDRQVIVNAPQAIKSVVVYDLLGKVIYVNNNINAQEFKSSQITVENQVVIVKVTLENQQIINKKVMNN